MKRSSWKKSFINYLLICKLQKKSKKLNKIKIKKKVKIKKFEKKRSKQKIGLILKKNKIKKEKIEKLKKKKKKIKKKKIRNKNKTFFYIMERNSTILPKMVGKLFFVHTGKEFVKLQVKRSMVGFKFGSFVLTRRKYYFKKEK